MNIIHKIMYWVERLIYPPKYKYGDIIVFYHVCPVTQNKQYPPQSIPESGITAIVQWHCFSDVYIVRYYVHNEPCYKIVDGSGMKMHPFWDDNRKELPL